MQFYMTICSYILKANLCLCMHISLLKLTEIKIEHTHLNQVKEKYFTRIGFDSIIQLLKYL